MKYLRLFENFEDVPTWQIKLICEKYAISDYTINSDRSIDVDGDVNLFKKGLSKMPLRFRKVTGSFFCDNNYLITLEGGPIEVGGDFDCNHNKLETLEWCPKIVGRDFDCNQNDLKTLEGSPDSINGDFNCSYNKLTSLKGSPRSVGIDFNCYNNRLVTLEGCPESIGRNFDCDTNRIDTFEYFPISLGGWVDFSSNPVYELWRLFGDHSKIELFNDYDIIRKDGIVLARLNSFLQDIGKSIVRGVNKYNNI